jgi:glycosyltransferase involved in cell wall biosynthesis
MRVCFVVTNTFALNAFLASPIDGLAAAGWEITVALNTADGEIAESIRRHAEVVDLAMRREISPIADLPVLARLWRLMRARRFDVVHSITPKAGALAMTASFFARVPVRMHTFTGQVWVTRQGILRRFLQAMESYVAACATHVLADSPSQREFMVSHGIVAADKLEVLAEGSICGVDIHRFRPRPEVRAARRQALGIPDDAIVLLYVGRLHPDKGLGELGCAFERLAARNPRVHLLLVGPDESGLAHVHSGVVNARSRVHAVGRTTEPEAYMAAADVFCLPSYREGFGMSLLEAAACGVPAVASRIYGITDAVDENVTGLLVPPRDADALAGALERIIQDAPLRLRLGAAARERAARLFAKDVLQQAWLGLYARQQHVEEAEEVRARPGNA